MTVTGFMALLPLIIIAVTAILVMAAVAFYRNHKLTNALTLTGFVIAFMALFIASSAAPQQVTPLLIIDGYALFFMGLLFTAGLMITVLSYDYLEGREINHDEFYILLLLATLGSIVLVASSHFASLFLGLEILSVSLYAMIAYLVESERGNEAGVKYLVLAAVSASFMLFGMALVYSQLGTMEFTQIAQKIAGNSQNAVFLTGMVMIIIGIGFKLAVVPFHMWTPDIYEGAPAPVTAFIATVSKGAMFALLLRYFTKVDIHAYSQLFLIFSAIAIASMFTGNLLALMQNNVKRILAYSSIAHLGYLLVAFLSGGLMAVTAVSYYLVAYFITMIGAFGVVTVFSGKDRDADYLYDYQGLAWRRPYLSVVFTAMLLSLAGIPLTAGFIGKFYVAAAGVGSSLWLLVMALAINSAIGLYYYLKIIAVLYMKEPEKSDVFVTAPQISKAGSLVMTVLALLLLFLGVYPSPLIRIIQSAIAGFI